MEKINLEKISEDPISNEIAQEIDQYIKSNPHAGVHYNGADEGVYDIINNSDPVEFLNSLSGENSFNGLSEEAQKAIRENPQLILDRINDLGLDGGFLEGSIPANPNSVQETVANVTPSTPTVEDLPQAPDQPEDIVQSVLSNMGIGEIPNELVNVMSQYSPYIAAGLLGAATTATIMYLWYRKKEMDLLKKEEAENNFDSVNIPILSTENNQEEEVYSDTVRSLKEVLDSYIDDPVKRGGDYLLYNVSSSLPHSGFMYEYKFYNVKSYPNSKPGLPKKRLSESDSIVYDVFRPNPKLRLYCDLIDNVYDSYEGLSKAYKDLEVKDNYYADDAVVIGGRKVPLFTLIESRIQNWHMYEGDLTISNMKTVLDEYLSGGTKSELFSTQIKSLVCDMNGSTWFDNNQSIDINSLSPEETKKIFDTIYITDALIAIGLYDIKEKVNKNPNLKNATEEYLRKEFTENEHKEFINFYRTGKI